MASLETKSCFNWTAAEMALTDIEAAESALALAAAARSSGMKSARAGRPELVRAGRAKTQTATAKKSTLTTNQGRVSKKEQPKAAKKALPFSIAAAKVRTIKAKPKAVDFAWGDDKETLPSDHLSSSGPSATPVPETAQPGPLANQHDEDLVQSLEELIQSTADRFEPVSTPPAERFEPVPTPSTVPFNPSCGASRPFDDDVALPDAQDGKRIAKFLVVTVGPYRHYNDGAEVHDFESSEDEAGKDETGDGDEIIVDRISDYSDDDGRIDVEFADAVLVGEAGEEEKDVEFIDAPPAVEQPAAVVAEADHDVVFRDCDSDWDDVDSWDVEMLPAENPFGAPSGAPAPNPGGFPSPSPFAQPPAGQPTTMTSTSVFAPAAARGVSPFAASPFGQPAAAAAPSSSPSPSLLSTTTPAFGASPFGRPSAGLSQFPSTAATTNTTTATPAFGAPTSSFNLLSAGRQPSPGPVANPFAPSAQPQPAAAVSNIPASTSSPFGIFTNSLSDAAQIGVTKPNPFDALKNAQQSGAAKPNPFDVFKAQSKPSSSSPAVSAPSFGGAKKAVHFADDAAKMGQQHHISPQPSAGTRKLSSFAVDYAQKVQSKLRSDGITAPKWPSDPGNPSQRPAMEKLKEAYKKYRARAYDSLRNAEIIDHPDRPRRLEDALAFKGICEDMCPDYEQVTRICEYDVKKEEKRPSPDGSDMWPEPLKMVKKFSRSAAGQEEPLPMDVRTVDALKRSTDYLLGDLLKADAELPALHGFLWDRTRAVRKDFVLHSQKTPEEMQVMVYVLETIARFHVVSLHLLSRKGVAPDDFDQQQEIQQLGASLLSLGETYDDCHSRNLVCENEGEFRAMYLLLNMHDTSVVEKSLEWASQPWYNSAHMENAKSLLAALQSFDQVTGPFHPRALGGHFAASAFTKFFDLVGSKTVSYTMACMCEIHFTWVRQRILQTLVKGFARRRDWPKDITPHILNRMLRFDTDDEAVEFARLHDFEFETRQVDNRQEQFLLLKSKRQHVPSPRVSQSHSATIVEAKRNGQPLAEVFRTSIYSTKDIDFGDGESGRSNVSASDKSTDNVDFDDGDDMFVGQSSSEKTADASQHLNGKQPEARPTTSPFGTANASPFAAPASPFAGNTSSLGGTTSPFATNTSPLGAKTSSFAITNATSDVPQPWNGTLKNGATAAPSQPSIPSTSPFSVQPKPAPFGSIKPATPQPATNNGPSPPLSQPAKATETSGFSVLGAAQQKAPGASVFSDMAKTPSPFQGFATGGSQSSTPNSTATPSTANKDTSVLSAKPATPQSSVFSSLTSDKSTPPSGGFFPTATPAAQPSSSIKPSTISVPPVTSAAPPTSSVGTVTSKPAAPPLSSVLDREPSVTTGTPTLASPSLTPQPGSISTQIADTQSKQAISKPTASTPKSAPPQKSDPMADFTKWFVQGDGGLLEEFAEFTVEGLVADAFEQFQREEDERRRREEDEASWAAARKHMAYNLSVKYFYRWRDNARDLAMRRILREGKAKYRAAMEAEARARREKRAAETRAAERKKAAEAAAREERLRNFTAADELGAIIAEAHRSRQSSAEEKLLASGVFAGVRNERQVARRVVKEAYLPPAKEERPRPRPLSSSSPEASLTSGQSMAPPSNNKKEGWKTRSLREKLHVSRRSSFSSVSIAGTGGTSNFSQSLPAGGGGKIAKPAARKVTNFSQSSASSSVLSRKRSADDGGNYYNNNTSADGPEAKKGRILKSGFGLHWELRRRGLVNMPDGQWLPERIATQMYEGKRFPGYGDCGLGPGKQQQRQEEEAGTTAGRQDHSRQEQQQQPSETSLRQSKLDALARRFGFPPSRRYARDGSTAASYVSSSASPPAAGKRKRDDDNNASSPTSNKKAHVDSAAVSEDEGSGSGTEAGRAVERALAEMRAQLRELNENMDVLEREDRPWMREQTARLLAGKGTGPGFGELNGGVRDEGG